VTRFVVADAVGTQIAWYERQGFVENRSDVEQQRVSQLPFPVLSMRLDLGPDPRRLL
jgi:hypothetical protein